MKILQLMTHQEAQEHRLDLSAHLQADVDRLITYMYTLDYAGGHVDDKHVDVRMFIIADYFDIDSLEDKAFEKLKQDVSGWTLEVVKTKQTLVVNAIQTAYAGRASRVCALITDKLVSLGAMTETRGRLVELIEEHPAFGQDSVMKMAKALSLERKSRTPNQMTYRCPKIACGAVFKADVAWKNLRNMTCYSCKGESSMRAWDIYASKD